MGLVEKLLIEKGIYYTISGSDLVTKCFNPDHQDSHPSFRIHNIKGIAHCLSCGHKLNIFKHFGLITNTANIKVLEIKEKIQAIKDASMGLEMLLGYVPMNTDFRGISKRTLEHFGAFYTDRVDGMQDRVIFPLRDISGKIKVFVGRHALSKANPRYMIYPAGSDMQIVPSKLEEPNNKLILVEGIFDMLNLYDKGLTNVAATMGTKVISDPRKLREKLLPFKSQGVTKIYICFDGDKAGKEASEDLMPKLKGMDFEVEVIDLEEDTDPGDLDQGEVNRLGRYINGKVEQES